MEKDRKTEMLYLLHECFKKHKNGKLMSLTKGRGVWDIALRTVKELKEHHAETGQKVKTLFFLY